MAFDASFFAFRTPLLPFDAFLAWGDALEAPSALDDDERLSRALAADIERLRASLREFVSRAEVRDALFVASRELHDALEFWVRDPDSARGRQLERALVRYFTRMTGRPTPFGLFASTSVGLIGETTRLAVGKQETCERVSRIDVGYLSKLADSIEPEIREALRYRPNSSLYRCGRQYRYADRGTDTNELVGVTATHHLETALARAAEGARPRELVGVLAGDAVSSEAAEAYVADLIDNQVLVPDFGVPATGPEPLDALIEQLGAVDAQIKDRLAEARNGLAALDASGLGASSDLYEAVIDALDGLPGEVERSRIFHVDLFRPAPGATLGPAVVGELLRGAELLRRLARPQEGSELDRFRDAFLARYENREVSLVEALDEETGIGFPPRDSGNAGYAEPLIAGLPFKRREETRAWAKRDDLLLRMVVEAAERRAREIVLGREEIEALAQEDPRQLPDAFAVLAVLAARTQAALDRGDFRLLVSGVGPSGVRLLGRYCHGYPELRRHVEEHVRSEEALEPDALFAEIAHLPEGRGGNLICRPALREHEIVYLGRSGLALERQLGITDLLLSVRDRRLVLRSARLGREVIPRLSSAHNFRDLGVPVYRFLASVQAEGRTSELTWDWGPLGSAPYLPRIRTGRLVLATAQWTLDEAELRRLGATRGTSRFRAVQDLRRERNLPRLAALADGSQVLPVDLDNVLSCESFVELVKSREQARLVEMVGAPDQLCAEGPEGRFVHHVLVPFVRVPDKVEKRDRPRRIRGRREPLSGRAHAPGSEWLYAKLYLGPTAADGILLDVVRPLIEDAFASGATDRWFFIRYGDPDWHLRIRVHGSPERLHAEVLPALETRAAPMLAEGRIRRLQLDTYEPEVERYGGPDGIEIAERLFHVDSDVVLELLETLSGKDGGERWRAALVGIDALLADAGLGPSEREMLVRETRTAYTKDFRVASGFRPKVAERFRNERRTLEALLDSSESTPWQESFCRRSERLAPIFAQLRAHEGAGRLSSPLTNLLPSYAHMHANRLLRSAHRRQELVLYEFLARLYHSRVVRALGPADPTN